MRVCIYEHAVIHDYTCKVCIHCEDFAIMVCMQWCMCAFLSRKIILHSAVPITQPPVHLASHAHPEDTVKARRPELDEETPQWCREQRRVENEDKKRGKRYKVLKPLFIFLSLEINGKFSLKQSLLSWF